MPVSGSPLGISVGNAAVPARIATVSPDASPSVVLPVASRMVNLPAAGVVPPIAGGEAKYVLKPVPDTVEEAESVVNAPAAGVVPPMAGGEAR